MRPGVLESNRIRPARMCMLLSDPTDMRVDRCSTYTCRCYSVRRFLPTTLEARPVADGDRRVGGLTAVTVGNPLFDCFALDPVRALLKSIGSVVSGAGPVTCSRCERRFGFQCATLWCSCSVVALRGTTPA